MRIIWIIYGNSLYFIQIYYIMNNMISAVIGLSEAFRPPVGWVVRWHHDARERLGKTGPRHGWSCPVSAVIGRFARPIAPGFVQLSCGGESVNLDEGQVARYGAMEAVYDPEACRYAADTGYPRLDRVLAKLYEEHGFLGPDEPAGDGAERAAPTHVLTSASPSSEA